MNSRTINFLILSLFYSLTLFAGTVQLADGGKALAQIVIEPSSPRAVQFAAQELKSHLEAITSAEFAIVTPAQRNKALYPIYIGNSSREAIKCSGEELVVDVASARTVLIGNDANEQKGMPELWEARGSLNATYEFLQTLCGVEWLDPTEVGTFIPRKKSLKVQTGVVRREPFVRNRDMAIEPEEWDKTRSPQEWQRWLEVAYPRAMARDGERAVKEAKKLFALRLRLGGANGRHHANHSFYWCYDRFWDTNNVNFVEYHPEWFSRSATTASKKQGDIYASVASKKPSQMCFSNPEFIKQTIKDVQAYFDAGGYTNRYTCQGVPASAANPVASWGKDVYCLEPMDNGDYCQCERCAAMYDKTREADSGLRSDYWFKFVNAVAREIKVSHPGRKIATLAYGRGREGLPTFPIEDNVVVHFCWDSNREPNRQPLFKQQRDLLKAWHAAYPERELGLWFYNGFPHESGTWFKYLPMPGFFGELCAREFRFIKQMNVRDTIFFCGAKDDFESFITAKLLWEPEDDYAQLKNRFFNSFGPAAAAIEEFYDTIETRYCTITNWQGFANHPERGHSWGLIIDGPTFDKLRTCMAAAERAVASSDQFYQQRVRNWRVGYWDYICEAKIPKKEMPSSNPAVKIVRTEFFGVERPAEFGERDILKGKPFVVTALDSSPVYFWAPNEERVMSNPAAMQLLTDERGFHGFMSSNNKTGIVYRCAAPVGKLKRLRLMTDFDPARKRFFFDIVGWKGGERVTLLKDFFVDEWSGAPSGVSAFVTYDFYFAPNSVPSNLDAIGIIDNCYIKNFNTPRYVRFEAATR